MSSAWSVRSGKAGSPSTPPRGSRRRPRRHRQAARLWVERLEDRLTPSNFTIMNTNDSGSGSLRDAITQAESAGSGTIVFAPGVTGTISLQTVLPTLTGTLSIMGPGANQLTVQRSTAPGTAQFGIFQVLAGDATVTLSGLTISNGANFDGGGIQNLGTLTLDGVTVDGNTASDEGGGIFNMNTLTVLNSTVSNNQNQSGGEGAGGIDSEGGSVTIINSTISGNQAINSHSAGGIGIYAFFSPSDVAVIKNSTISNNTASGASGGGIDSTDPGSKTTLFDTIVAGNSGGSGADIIGNGFTSQGHNLIGNITASAFGTPSSVFGPSDQVGTASGPVDAMLGQLQNNGGPTATMLPGAGSPAINAGDPANAPPSDQRGLPRVVGGQIDIGAVESPANPTGPFASQVTVTASPASPSAGQPVTLTAVVGPAVPGATTQVPGGSVTFTVDKGSAVPQTLSGGQAAVPTQLQPGNHSVTVNYPGDPNFTAGVGTLPLSVGGSSPSGPGITLTWNGHLDDHWDTQRQLLGGGLDSNWTSSDGQSGEVPQAGDDLVFPAGAMHPDNVNDIPSGDVPLAIHSITFSGTGYTLRGNALAVTASLADQSASTAPDNSIQIDLTLANGVQVAVRDPGRGLDLAGAVSGAGSISKEGAGRVVLMGNSPLGGITTVNAGTLLVDDSQPGSAVVVNAGGTLGGSGTVGAVTVNAGGTVSPGDSPGVLTVHGGITFNPGSVLLAQINGPAAGSGYDQLNVQGSVTLNGPTLRLSFGFVPARGQDFVLIANNGSGPVRGSFAGIPDDALLAHGASFFDVSYAGGRGQDVDLLSESRGDLFVRALFTDFGAPSSRGARAPFEGRVAGGESRLTVAREFLVSPARREGEVNQFYAAFGQPDDGLKGRYVAQLLAGVPAGQVLINFLTSASFRRLHHGNRAFVRALFAALLGQAPGRHDLLGHHSLSFYVGQLSAGAITRAHLAQELLSSDEVYAAAVRQNFATFLGMTPSDAQAQALAGQLASGAMTPDGLSASTVALDAYIDFFLGRASRNLAPGVVLVNV